MLLKRSLGVALGVTCSLLASAPLAHGHDIAAGADLARRQCSSCHDISGRPNPPFRFAPAFGKIAATEGMTETAIHAFLLTPHTPMPNFILTEREIGDVAAYIVSLHAPGPPDVDAQGPPAR